MHDIIIPHKGREHNLGLCLASLRRSAERCGIEDYRIHIVGEWDNDPPSILLDDGFRQHCLCYGASDDCVADVPLYPDEAAPFWKSHLLNNGIEMSNGDVLTFLDADAIVGRYFLRGPEVLAASTLTLLSYRVRYCPATVTEHSHEELFRHYDAAKPNGSPLYRIGHEAYGQPDGGTGKFKLPAFGNSQFTIRRDVLGETRYDERYFGRGYEDLDILRRICQKCMGRYSAAIMTAGDYAMFHINHKYSPGYGSDRWNVRNRRRYYKQTCLWIVGGDWDQEWAADTFADRVAEHDTTRFVADDDDTWRAEVIPELDNIVTCFPEADQ